MKLEEGGIIAEHYQLKKQLGHGSFGDVWLAHNMLADIDVAIKFYGTFDEQGLESFRKEFKVAYRLNHPNLLNISHFDIYESCPYLVMPYCANGSVAKQIGKMPESEIWKFVHDVSSGLAFLHSQQPPVIHQDIKPDNILITGDGRYVISDFGISRNLRTQMSRTMNNQNSSGTLAYMGPERFSEQPLIVLASDIWAFGMTLYEVITGDVLWEGMGGCVQLNGARIPAMDNVSPALSQLVTNCLEPETWNRPTASQICEYATAHLHQKPLPRLHTASAAPTPSQPAKPVERQQPVRPHHYTSSHSSVPQAATPSSAVNWKKRGMIIAAVCLATLALVGGGILLSNSISEEQDYSSCKTLQDYEQFIKEHPNSRYVSAARTRIATMAPSESTTADDAPKASTSTKETPRSASVATVKTTTIVAESPAESRTSPSNNSAMQNVSQKQSAVNNKGSYQRELTDYSDEYLPGSDEGVDIVNSDVSGNQQLPISSGLVSSDRGSDSRTSVHVNVNPQPSMGYRSGGSPHSSGYRSGGGSRSHFREGTNSRRSSSSSQRLPRGGSHRR